jgi:hypothetical protein
LSERGPAFQKGDSVITERITSFVVSTTDGHISGYLSRRLTETNDTPWASNSSTSLAQSASDLEGPVVGVEQGNLNEPARYRRTRARWSRTSLTGKPLTVRSLSSAVTRTASYQMTICAIKHAD